MAPVQSRGRYQYLADPELGLGRLVTHRLPLSHWERGLELAAHAREEALKVAFVFEDRA